MPLNNIMGLLRKTILLLFLVSGSYTALSCSDLVEYSYCYHYKYLFISHQEPNLENNKIQNSWIEFDQEDESALGQGILRRKYFALKEAISASLKIRSTSRHIPLFLFKSSLLL